MNPAEPSLLSHLTEVRSSYFGEGGLSTVIYCGKFNQDMDASAVLQTHSNVIEEEENSESTNITGMLIVQVHTLIEADIYDRYLL